MSAHKLNVRWCMDEGEARLEQFKDFNAWPVPTAFQLFHLNVSFSNKIRFISLTSTS